MPIKRLVYGLKQFPLGAEILDFPDHGFFMGPGPALIEIDTRDPIQNFVAAKIASTQIREHS